MTGHPAVFSDAVLEVMADCLPARGKVRVLDPFAGVGKIHGLAEGRVGIETWGVEIEPEWATIHERTVVGDAMSLPFRDGVFDCVATSPTYGNRMADSHTAREVCKACSGTGSWPPPTRQVCEKCNGAGVRSHTRITYTHKLGRKLHPNNSGAMQWGPAYRLLHWYAWSEAARVLRPGGRFLLNVKNHIRKGVEVDVHGWHVETLEEYGMKRVWTELVKTPNMGFGANREARTEGEFVTVLMKGWG